MHSHLVCNCHLCHQTVIDISSIDYHYSLIIIKYATIKSAFQYEYCQRINLLVSEAAIEVFKLFVDQQLGIGAVFARPSHDRIFNIVILLKKKEPFKIRDGRRR